MVNHDTLINREYFDPVTKQMITVNLPVLDALYLDALRKIEDAVRRLK